ncbi:hypothetical protein RI054_02g08370 [Pseudoscourfieldia marina]
MTHPPLGKKKQRREAAIARAAAAAAAAAAEHQHQHQHQLQQQQQPAHRAPANRAPAHRAAPPPAHRAAPPAADPAAAPPAGGAAASPPAGGAAPAPAADPAGGAAAPPAGGARLRRVAADGRRRFQKGPSEMSREWRVMEGAARSEYVRLRWNARAQKEVASARMKKARATRMEAHASILQDIATCTRHDSDFCKRLAVRREQA